MSLERDRMALSRSAFLFGTHLDTATPFGPKTGWVKEGPNILSNNKSSWLQLLPGPQAQALIQENSQRDLQGECDRVIPSDIGVYPLSRTEQESHHQD